jgi:hypothetical protein
MAILIENRLARRRQAQPAARASRPVFRLLNASEILQFAAPALAALRVYSAFTRSAAGGPLLGCAIKLALPGRRYSK